MSLVVKLSLRHDACDSNSKVLQGVGRGWPGILSSLKSLLELGKLPVLDVAHFE